MQSDSGFGTSHSFRKASTGAACSSAGKVIVVRVDKEARARRWHLNKGSQMKLHVASLQSVPVDALMSDCDA